jgi:hypothetical protein
MAYFFDHGTFKIIATLSDLYMMLYLIIILTYACLYDKTIVITAPIKKRLPSTMNSVFQDNRTHV